jgi:hypothetical protein
MLMEVIEVIEVKSLQLVAVNHRIELTSITSITSITFIRLRGGQMKHSSASGPSLTACPSFRLLLSL